MNDLEKQLKMLKPMGAPLDLRRKVLGACEKVEEKAVCLTWGSGLMRALYPGHVISMGLAVAWLVILALRFDTPPSEIPSGVPFSVAKMREIQREKVLLLAQMDSPRFEADPDRGHFSIPKEELKTN